MCIFFNTGRGFLVKMEPFKSFCIVAVSLYTGIQTHRLDHPKRDMHTEVHLLESAHKKLALIYSNGLRFN